MKQVDIRMAAYGVIMLAMLAGEAVMLTGCQPPPVQVDFSTTDSTVCITMDPDSLTLGEASIIVQGSRIVICYPKER